MKINSDGACIHGGLFTSCGGAVRDWMGQWIGGFAQIIGKGSVIMAELNGMLEGLKLAWELGARKVCLESDSINAISLVEHGCSRQHSCYRLVMEISELLKKEWQVKITHICRENNKVADLLAKLALRKGINDRKFSLPPQECAQLLLADVESAAAVM